MIICEKVSIVFFSFLQPKNITRYSFGNYGLKTYGINRYPAKSAGMLAIRTEELSASTINEILVRHSQARRNPNFCYFQGILHSAMITRLIILIFIGTLHFQCSTQSTTTLDKPASMTEAGFAKHLQRISSDEFQGRKPFTEGERKTIGYLQVQFKELGLEAGNGTSYLQEVPMAEITTTTDSVMKISSSNRAISLRGFHDFILNSERTDAAFEWRNEEVVFAGFGVVAPEYNWNDYEGLNVKGKIVLVMVNDPGFGGGDTTFFKGNAMTYYGRWTYKYEEAARQGAKGCFVIHNTVAAGYPFGVLQNSWNNPHLYLDERGKDVYHCEGVGWLTQPATERIFKAAGLDFGAEVSSARKPGYKGKSLGVKINVGGKVSVRFDKSHNVVAKITGKTRPDEYIVYSAHWDHLGIGKPDAKGDSIYNGAFDNASGTAGLLEIAKAFKELEPAPERTVVFLALTAEEQGLWGAAYYASNPLFDLKKTVANINMDGINLYGKMKDILVIGKGQSELEDYLTTEAKNAGREVIADLEPEKGYYFRSDHFHFAKVGVPALYTREGANVEGKGSDYGRELKDIYTRKYYHQPSDEFDTTRLRFDGAIDDLQLLFLVGKRLAVGNEWPSWKKGSEFRR
jgi:Zn-dependent M28 family amino/carboxypeptidase